VKSPRFFAFISYSHADKRWAEWLHRSLETYRIPARLVGQTTSQGAIPKRLSPIFRDRDELASATDLSRTVNAALEQSANLIIICSPRAAKSRWVDEEVRAFKRMGRSERIFCLIVDGEPNASDIPGRADEECLAPALRFVVDAQGQSTGQRTEPVAADAREGQDGRANAKLKLIAGLLGIGFDALKRRELQRRNRRLVMMASAALVVMTLTTALAISAVLARNAAQRRQKQAEDLVAFMLGDLNDKLLQLARLDILETVDNKAMDYFQSLPLSDVTDSALVQRVKALEKIGIVRQDQGHLPAAMESFTAAARLAGALADASPHDAPRQIAYSRELAFVGMTHWSSGELDRAQKSFEAAQRALQRAETHSTSADDVLYQLSVIDNDIGHVLEARGKFVESEMQYRDMLAHCRQLVAAPNAKSKWMVQLGSAHNNLGQIALARGDLIEAVAEYTADDAIESALAQNDPKNNDQLENQMRVRAILGRTLALAGAVDASVLHLREAVELSAQLVKVDPTNSEFQEYDALYSSQLSRLLRLQGDLATATSLNAHALATFTELTRQDPDNSLWQQEYADALSEQAAQSLTVSRRADARAQTEAALRILDPLLVGHPDSRNLLIATSRARLLLAVAIGDTAESDRLRQTTFEALGAGSGPGEDARLLALQASALVESGHAAQAAAVLERLRNTGYRDPSLLKLLAREHIEYPIVPEVESRLRAAMQRVPEKP
jgi:eukaryotic-like serine/threonine-protein kinase